MADTAGEQVQTLKMNDGQYDESVAAGAKAGAGASTALATASASSWWGAWVPTWGGGSAANAQSSQAPSQARPKASKPPLSQATLSTTTKHWLKHSLSFCCCSSYSNVLLHMPTRRSPGGVLRKYDDLELHRRRSTTVLLDPPNSSDSGKALSFGRARNSGVSRLWRSSTSSCNSSSSHPSPSTNANLHSINSSSSLNTNVKSGSATIGLSNRGGGALSLSAVDQSNGNGSTAEQLQAPGVSGANDKDSSAAVSAVHLQAAQHAHNGHNSHNLDHLQPHSENEPATDSQSGSEGAIVSEYQGHFFPEHVWSHVVLKMTAFSDEDTVTSFRFGTQGGTIGRDPALNSASIPADKLLKKDTHAKILYAHGGFYIQNCDESSSGTFVRLGPCAEDDDDEEGRMQWPLDPNVAFRAGKSDFLVTKYNEAEQTLELAALSGKLQGSMFTITTDGAGIGRSADNEIHAGDGELSRKHAAIWFDELTHKFYLIDLNSTNGTFMKLVGPYNEPYRLEIGDDLLISQTCVTVNRFDFGVHANMGARKHMEDAHTIIQDLNIESLSCLGLHPQSYFAVYDGHGGAEASSFLGDTLHHNIIDEFRFKKKNFDPLLKLPQEEIHAMIRQRLISAFEKTDEEFLHDSERPQAGSTATTVFIAGNQMFVANVGDSRTVLSRKRLAVRLSNDHKPSRPDEAQRIRDTGGFVIHGRIMGELAVSRAFGDSPFKTFEVPEPPPKDENGDEKAKLRSDYDSQELPVNPNDILKGPLVIATPEVTTTEITDDDEFLLLASDGLFDVLKDQDAVDFLRQKMVELHDVQRAVEAMVEHAIFQQRSTDNVTAVVIMFKEPKDFQATA